MKLDDVIGRSCPPAPWEDGDNIPWDDPAFSERMLTEHLSQAHHLASRKTEVIDRQVAWVHREVLGGRPTSILDLTCGPGLYTNRLARLGHACVGIDFGPASIRYAEKEAEAESLACAYRQADVREAEFGSGYGLVMMLFGQLNVFRRSEARTMLERACVALAPEGLLLLEPQRHASVERGGKSGSAWYTCGEAGGLFSDRPHLCLTEAAWDEATQSATQRFYIVDAETAEVTRHALTNEAYTEEEFRNMLAGVGFADIRFLPSLVGAEVEEESQAANMVILARKAGTFQRDSWKTE